MLIGSPSVVNGAIYIGSNDGNLYAVDAESGTQKWKFDAKSRVPSTPAVSGGIVYFGTYDGNFYAVDAASGALKMEIQDRARKAIRRKALAWSAACGRNHARSA
jgi:outer membrane protein assembly factor BamB